MNGVPTPTASERTVKTSPEVTLPILSHARAADHGASPETFARLDKLGAGERLSREGVLVRAIVLAVGFLLAAVSPAAASSARVWVTTPDGAEKMHDRGDGRLPPRRLERADDHASTRAGATRRWTASAPRSPTRRARVLYRLSQPHARRRDARPVRPTRQAVVPAPADGRLGLRRRARTTPTTTCRPGRPTTRLRHFSHRARPRRRSCRCCARRSRSTRELKVMGTPWSPPAWMKTNDSLIGGRLIDDPAHLRRLRPLLREVRAGLRARRRADLRAHAAERAAEPQPERLPGHGHAGRARRRS